MYIQIRDSNGTERFIEAKHLESGIASGEVVAFRRSDGWMTVSSDSFRGKSSHLKTQYRGQERRRGALSLKRMFPETDEGE